MISESAKNIVSDSKLVTSGSIFIAIKGTVYDGHDYIEQAIKKGAKTIILENKNKIIPEYENKVSFFLVEDTRVALAEILSKTYPQPKNIIAVTGTNGKTSVVNFVMQIMDLLGHNCASVGTMGIRDNRKIFDNRKEFQNLTTPDPIVLHQAMEGMIENQIDTVAIEASSHGLEQHRVDGLNIKAAAFTSFSQDHLDYHKTMEAYLEAKMRLFTEVLKDGSHVVLNSDMKEFKQIKNQCLNKKHKILSYGKNGDFIRIQHINYNDGLNCVYEVEGKEFNLNTKLLGEFQIYNIMAAFGLVKSLGYKVDEIAKVLPKLKPIKGRLDRVGKSEVYIDFSHTPDSLEKALEVMRQHLEGKLIVVFGCGGDRDKTKRPKMGEVAKRLADIVYVTDDNPRTEDPKQIRKDIIVACQGALEVDDREDAIKQAVKSMRKGDRLLIAGKGHEDYQIIGTKKNHFDDREVAEKYLV
ncbi:MAG: UDP-N-acetylmuramoyl-L-alanyl-D-glutamate--2,6-diaminopimelate ligase [Rickettsiales bacterium]